MQANCLKVRRALLTEPASAERTHRAHLRECPPCASAAREASRFEGLLGRAAQVEVPEGLAERILMHHEFARAGQRRRRRLWAMAASVLLAVGVGAGVWLERTVHRPAIGAEVLAHVSEEFWAFDPRTPQGPDTIQVVLDRVGASLLRPIEDTTFVALCPFGKGVAAHLVIRTASGPVTVLLAPGREVGRTLEVHGERGVGLVLPSPGGALALVGPDRETLERVAARLREAIAWGERSARARGGPASRAPA